MGYPNGAGLDMSNYGTWNYYKPRVEQVNFATPYRIDINIKTPSTSEYDMRNFNFIGYDLIIGYGDPRPDFQNGGYFVGTSNSLVIDGFHNFGVSINDEPSHLTGVGFLDNYQPNQTLQLSTNFYHGNDSFVFKNELGQEQWIDYGGSHQKLTMLLLKRIIRENSSFFVRPWVRSRAASNDTPNTPNGYIYGGYDNFGQPGKYGHTFNNGILITVPKPAVICKSNRLNDYMDGSNTNYPIELNIVMDPNVYQYRAPKDNLTISQSGGRCTLENKIMPWSGYQLSYEIFIYATGDWDKSGNGVQVYHNTFINTSMDRDYNNNKPWVFPISIDSRNFNDLPNHQGARILFRVETYYGDPSFSWKEGPLDNGFSAYGWNDGPNHWISGGLNMQYMIDTGTKFQMVTNNCINDTYPVSNPQVNVSVAPRRDGILRPIPATDVTFIANSSDPNGDNYTKEWKLRSKQVFESEKDYWLKDVFLNDFGNSNDRITMNTDQILSYLENRFGGNVDGREIGRETILADSFNDNGHAWSSITRGTGDGWTGYKLEYPLTNLVAKLNGLRTGTTRHNVDALVGRTLSQVLSQFNCKNANGFKYYVELNYCANPPVNGAARDSVGLSESGWFGDWENRYNNWKSVKDFNNVDMYSRCGNNASFRRRYVSVYIGVVSNGGWTYDKGYDYNSGSDIAYLNGYPDCTNNLTQSYTDTNSFTVELMQDTVVSGRDTVLVNSTQVSPNLSYKATGSAWGPDTKRVINLAPALSGSPYNISVFIRVEFTVNTVDPVLSGVGFNVGFYFQSAGDTKHNWIGIGVGKFLSTGDSSEPLVAGKRYVRYVSRTWTQLDPQMGELIPWAQIGASGSDAAKGNITLHSCKYYVGNEGFVNLSQISDIDNCRLHIQYAINDIDFNLATARIDIVTFDRCVTIKNQTGMNSSKSYSGDEWYNITKEIVMSGVDDTPYIGKNCECHIHGDNQFEFSQTWDGTRPTQGVWMKNFTYFRGPRSVQYLSNTKDEDVTIYMDHEGNYPLPVEYRIKVKKDGQTDDQAVSIASNVQAGDFIVFNPAKTVGFSENDRGSTFIILYDIIVYKDSNKSDVLAAYNSRTNYFNNRWQYNEKPTIGYTQSPMPFPGNDSDNIFEGGNIGNWGIGTNFTLSSDDPDKKVIKVVDSNGVVMYNTPFNNSGFVSDSVSLSYTVLKSTYALDGKTLYPIPIYLGKENYIKMVATSTDQFGASSNTININPCIITREIRRRNVTYKAGPNATKVGDTVYGKAITFDFDLEFYDTCKFQSDDYVYSHEIQYRNITSSSPEFQPLNDGNSCHNGVNIPDHVSLTVNVDNNPGTFTPGEKYTFIIVTRIQNSNGDRLYSNRSNPFALFTFGSAPVKPQVIFPTNRRQPLENPPIIVRIPNQTDVTNQNINDIALVINGNNLGWNSSMNYCSAGNFNNRTIGLKWTSNLGNNKVIKVKIIIKSALTGLTQESDEVSIFCGYDSMALSRGQEIVKLQKSIDAINNLRDAYGLSNYNFPNMSRGTYVSFTNLVRCITDAYNDLKRNLRDNYGVPYTEVSVTTQDNYIRYLLGGKLEEILTKYTT